MVWKLFIGIFFEMREYYKNIVKFRIRGKVGFLEFGLFVWFLLIVFRKYVCFLLWYEISISKEIYYGF